MQSCVHVAQLDERRCRHRGPDAPKRWRKGSQERRNGRTSRRFICLLQCERGDEHSYKVNKWDEQSATEEQLSSQSLTVCNSLDNGNADESGRRSGEPSTRTACVVSERQMMPRSTKLSRVGADVVASVFYFYAATTAQTTDPTTSVLSQEPPRP